MKFVLCQTPEKPGASHSRLSRLGHLGGDLGRLGEAKRGDRIANRSQLGAEHRTTTTTGRAVGIEHDEGNLGVLAGAGRVQRVLVEAMTRHAGLDGDVADDADARTDGGENLVPVLGRKGLDRTATATNDGVADLAHDVSLFSKWCGVIAASDGAYILQTLFRVKHYLQKTSDFFANSQKSFIFQGIFFSDIQKLADIALWWVAVGGQSLLLQA